MSLFKINANSILHKINQTCSSRLAPNFFLSNFSFFSPPLPTLRVVVFFPNWRWRRGWPVHRPFSTFLYFNISIICKFSCSLSNWEINQCLLLWKLFMSLQLWEFYYMPVLILLCVFMSLEEINQLYTLKRCFHGVWPFTYNL